MTTDTLLQAILPKLQRGDAPDSQWPDVKGEYHALCPFHADEHVGNFSVSVRGFGCFACQVQGGLRQLAEHLGVSEQAQDDGLTLQAYSDAKKLPLEFLRKLGLADGSYYWKEARRYVKAIKIPYPCEDGKGTRMRWRLFLRKGRGRDDRFRWAGKGPLYLYGLWRMEAIRKTGRALLVEGESDCHTALLYDMPVFGVPGASNFSAAMAQCLRGLDVYVWREPDDAGAKFAARVGELVPGARVVVAPDGVKDISEAHIKGLDVPTLLQNLMAGAQPIGASQTGAPEAKTLADLAPWVHETLASKDQDARSKRLAVSRGVVAWLLGHKRLLIDGGQDSQRGGRPYLLADDGTLWPLEMGSVSTRLVLHQAGLNGRESTYVFVLEEVIMATYEHGTHTTLARWQQARGDMLYMSCSPTSQVRARNGRLEHVPNGTDGVWFAGDAAYPAWQPTEPVCPLTLAAFQPNLHTPNEVRGYTPGVQQTLLAVWLATIMSGLRPLPLLVLLGNRGGGKTTLANGALHMLLGPSARVSSLTQDPRDFWILTTGTPVATLDNLDSDLPVWFPDQLAATITGVAVTTRHLYTDSERLTRPTTAALIVTTRTAAFARPDIAERSLPLLVVEFDDGKRSADSDLMADVDRQRDGLISWCAATASVLLAERQKAPAGLPLRFVDFAKLTWAYCASQGYPEMAAGALLALRQAQALTIGETDPLIEAIVAGLGDSWSGAASELPGALADGGATVPYLGGGKAIARQLREAKAALALVGIVLQEIPGRAGHAPTFTLHRVAESAESAEFPKTSTNTKDASQVFREFTQDSANLADSASNLSDDDYYAALASEGGEV